MARSTPTPDRSGRRRAATVRRARGYSGVTIRRTLTTLLACAGAFALAAPALSASAGPVGPKRPSAGASLIACHSAVDQLSRFAVFQGEMRALGRGNRMEIRFDLQQQLPGRGFRNVGGPGLGTWNSSKSNVLRYRFRKRIENLQAPAAYRAVVRFRWFNATGAQIAHATRKTRACGQRDLRPNLRITRADATLIRGGQARYALVLRNVGRAYAGNFDAVLTIDGAAQPARTVGGLRPGARATVTVVGPRCTPGRSVVAAVDPDNRVVESREDDNTARFPCRRAAG